MSGSVKIAPDWGKLLESEFEKPYFQKLVSFVRAEYESARIYPPGNQIFNAFDNCPLEKVRVVIVGQDPYHGPGQANGLCFSVSKGLRLPPSLKNIFAEVFSDTGRKIPVDGDLSRWAEQGVLLLNATLTVREHAPGSHQNRGWEEFTDRVISLVAEKKKHLVFMLWGAYAQKKGSFIDRKSHLVLDAAHPSPFSVHRGFFGCRHFSKANEYLKQFDFEPIDW